MLLRAALIALFTVAVSLSSAQAAPRRPAIVVTMVIDQFAAWIASERLPLLPADGGFARLRREGTWARVMTYEHAVCDTAPGHAALYTGAPPRQSGIFANETVDDTHHRVSILRDPDSRVIGVDGPRALVSSSLRALALPTLADALRAAEPRATIVSLSLKDRAALPGGGRAPTASIWYDKVIPGFVTSTAVAKDFPAWARPLVASERLRSLEHESWMLDAREQQFVRAHAAGDDDAPGEGVLPGERATFPHALAEARDPGNAFRVTPFADDTLLALGLGAVDARDRDQPMLLAVSLSSNDYIGHVYGPDSWESWAELARLDGALAKFFAALDERVGADNWALVLAADHGVTTMPEAAPFFAARPWCRPGAPRDRFERSCATAGRVLPDELGELLRAVAARTLGPGDWIAGIADPYVYLSPAGRALDGDRRRALDEALTFALRSTPGVAQVFDARHPPSSCAKGDSVAALVCRALPPPTAPSAGTTANTRVAAGELYVLLQPGWFFDPDLIIGKGSSHGSPYLSDRAVPLFVRAPGRVPAGRILERTIAAAAFARTAASLLGVAPPPGARGGLDLTAR